LSNGTFISIKIAFYGYIYIYIYIYIYNIIPVQVMRERKSQYRASRSGGLRIAPAELTGTTLPSDEWNL